MPARSDIHQGRITMCKSSLPYLTAICPKYLDGHNYMGVDIMMMHERYTTALSLRKELDMMTPTKLG